MLDTNIVSVLMRDQHGSVRQRLEVLGPEAACMSIISLGELRFGVEKTPSTKVALNLRRLLSGLQVVAFEASADEHYGRIRAHLAGSGRPIGPNDTWIAAHALSLGLILVTANVREFSRVPGLVVENWLD
jgi:tRNA(fMet)-specific endonuclease VapC